MNTLDGVVSEFLHKHLPGYQLSFNQDNCSLVVVRLGQDPPYEAELRIQLNEMTLTLSMPKTAWSDEPIQEGFDLAKPDMFERLGVLLDKLAALYLYPPKCQGAETPDDGSESYEEMLTRFFGPKSKP